MTRALNIFLPVVCVIIGMLIARSCEKEPEIKEPDLSKYQRVEDSLNSEIHAREKQIAGALSRIDSIQKTIKQSHEKVNKQSEALRLLSDDRLEHWNDSVLKWAGLR